MRSFLRSNKRILFTAALFILGLPILFFASPGRPRAEANRLVDLNRLTTNLFVPRTNPSYPPSQTAQTASLSWNNTCQPSRGGNYAENTIWENNSMYFNDSGKLEWSSHNVLNESHDWSFGIVQFRADCSESTIVPLPGATVTGKGGETA